MTDDTRRARATRFPIGACVTVEQLTDDPHPVLARLRASEPVSWVPALSGWLVTRHDLVSELVRDHRAYTVDDPRFSTAQVVGPSMLSLDGAEHARHRAPFARAFQPAAVRSGYTELVEAEARRLVAVLRNSRPAEIRAGLAGPLAVTTLAAALGLVAADPDTIMRWYAAIVGAVSAISVGEPPEPDAAEAVAELRAQVEVSLSAEHSSLLIEAARTPDGLDVSETVANAAVIMFGGIDTTEGMIANLVAHLLADNDALAAVRADQSWLPAAIEESLRLEPAAARVDRYTTQAVRLGEVDLPAGDLVIASLSGANRDPGVFPEPDRFRLDRSNRHLQLAFARGPHVCPGMDLARLETHAALTALLALPGLRLDRPTHPTGLVFRRPKEVFVTWDQTSGGGKLTP
ncbi:MAG: cytochrome P450 [Actinobacteria bacterium]|nr:cytochrome P450 [Actinomycetota bacterium]